MLQDTALLLPLMWLRSYGSPPPVCDDHGLDKINLQTFATHEAIWHMKNCHNNNIIRFKHIEGGALPWWPVAPCRWSNRLTQLVLDIEHANLSCKGCDNAWLALAAGRQVTECHGDRRSLCWPAMNTTLLAIEKIKVYGSACQDRIDYFAEQCALPTVQFVDSDTESGNASHNQFECVASDADACITLEFHTPYTMVPPHHLLADADCVRGRAAATLPAEIKRSGLLMCRVVNGSAPAVAVRPVPGKPMVYTDFARTMFRHSAVYSVKVFSEPVPNVTILFIPTTQRLGENWTIYEVDSKGSKFYWTIRDGDDGHYNYLLPRQLILVFKDGQIPCVFSGLYDITLCNRYGCAQAEFTIEREPTGVCTTELQVADMFTVVDVLHIAQAQAVVRPTRNGTTADADEVDMLGVVATKQTGGSHLHHAIWTATVALGLLAILLTVLVLVKHRRIRELVLRRRRTAQRKVRQNTGLTLANEQNRPLQRGSSGAAHAKLTGTTISAPPHGSNNPVLTKWLSGICGKKCIPIIDASTLNILNDIGEGNFGRVFLAEASHRQCCRISTSRSVSASRLSHCATGNNNVNSAMAVHYSNCCPLPIGEYVALKQLKFVSDEKLHELEAEAEILVTLSHANIVNFYGVTVVHDALALVFEYMDMGDLVTYLRDHNPDLVDDNAEVLQLKDLLKISMQAVCAVEYLAQKNLVHRDIAARNCLVGSQLVVKLSDFGMSRSLYTSDYYKIDHTTVVPLRWLPPECILYRKFNTESDIWSLGVLLWEIFSYGQVPWSIYSNCEVMEILKRGQLLERPERCPVEIYKHLILRCWESKPHDRLSATQAKAIVEECLECTSMYVNVVDVTSASSRQGSVHTRSRINSPTSPSCDSIGTKQAATTPTTKKRSTADNLFYLVEHEQIASSAVAI